MVGMKYTGMLRRWITEKAIDLYHILLVKQLKRNIKLEINMQTLP